jgi:hypothetical protein
LGEFSGPVGDVGVGNHAKGEHGANLIMELDGMRTPSLCGQADLNLREFQPKRTESSR